MFVINTLIAGLIGLIDNVLPIFGIPDSFFDSVDQMFVLFIQLIKGASWLIPFDTLITCLGVMLIVDNFALLMQVGQFILKLVRG